MQRHLLGLSALVLLAIGAVTFGSSDSGVSGVCLRAGAVLATMWVAWPQLQAVPIWLIAVIGVALVVAMRHPKLLLAVVPLAIVLWLLRPRPRRE
jgi:hypothetical protein